MYLLSLVYNPEYGQSQSRNLYLKPRLVSISTENPDLFLKELLSSLGAVAYQISFVS